MQLYTVSEIELNLSLDFISQVFNWLKENNLILNMTKTECLLFGTRQRLKLSGVGEDFAVPINGAPVNFCTVFKYLVVRLDDSYSNFSYSEYVRYVATKVSQKWGLMSYPGPSGFLSPRRDETRKSSAGRCESHYHATIDVNQHHEID